MTQYQAEALAKFDPSYVARRLRGQWCVWCTESDHMVEFDQKDIDGAVNPEDCGPWK